MSGAAFWDGFSTCYLLLGAIMCASSVRVDRINGRKRLIDYLGSAAFGLMWPIVMVESWWRKP